MKKKLFFLLPLIFIFTFSCSFGAFADGEAFKVVSGFQWDSIGMFSDNLCSVTKGGKYGFIDSTGKVVINPQFKFAGPFYDGLSLVMQSNKYGYINKSGKYAISPQFEYARAFSEGLAVVKKGGKYGYIDKTGKIVIKPQWDYASGFQNGVAFVQNEKRGNYDFIPSTGINGPFGVIDKKGKIISSLKWDYVGPVIGSDSLLLVQSNKKYGIMDKSGKILVEPQWSDIGWFEKGFDIASYQKNGKWGIFDRKGKIISEPQWDKKIVEENSLISGGFIAVSRDSKWGFLDYSGKVVIEPKWKSVYSFYNGISIVHTELGKASYINTKGDVVLETSWDNAAHFENGRAKVSNINDNLGANFVLGYIDEKGNTIIGPEWDSLSNFFNGIALANKGYWISRTDFMSYVDFYPGKWYSIDEKGSVIMEYPWDSVRFLSDKYLSAVNYEKDGDGLARLDNDSAAKLKFAIIDTSGNIVMEPQFTEAKLMEDYNFIRVAKGKSSGFMNKSLELIGDSYWDQYVQFGNLLLVTKGGKTGAINISEGTLSITPQFDSWELRYLRKDKLCAAMKNGKWGVISIPSYIP